MNSKIKVSVQEENPMEENKMDLKMEHEKKTNVNKSSWLST